MPRGRGPGGDFRVYLRYVDGNKKRLNEYNAVSTQATDDEPAGMHSWVGNDVGREYKIVIKDVASGPRKQKEAIFVTVRIDGRECIRGTLVLGSKSFEVETISVYRDGVTTERLLKFAAIDTVDDRCDAEVDAEDAAELGSISIELENGWILPTRKKEQLYAPAEVKPVGFVYEKDCKLGQMTVGGAEVVTAPEGTSRVTSEGDTDGECPFYIFNIKYAPRERIEDMLASKARPASPDRQSSSRQSTPAGSEGSSILLPGTPHPIPSSSLESDPAGVMSPKSETASPQQQSGSVGFAADDEEREVSFVREVSRQSGRRPLRVQSTDAYITTGRSSSCEEREEDSSEYHQQPNDGAQAESRRDAKNSSRINDDHWRCDRSHERHEW